MGSVGTARWAAALLGVAVVSLLALEGLVRLAAALSPAVGDAVQPGTRGVLRGIVREDQQIGYGLVPGYVGRGENPIHVAINSLGLRDREYDLRGADAGRRFVLAAGDSFSFGAGVELDETLLSHLETRLQEADASWAVAKAGVPGYNLLQSVATVRRHLDGFKPELVIVQVVPQTEERNLVPQRVVGGVIIIPRPGWHYYVAGEDVFDSPFAPGLLAEADLWARRLSYTYRVARRAALVALARGDDPSAAEHARARALGFEALRELDRDLRARGVPLLVVLNNWAQESVAEWDAVRHLNQEYARFCRANGIEVLDTWPLFKAETDRVGYLGRTPADRHWNPAGHRLAAESILHFARRRGWLGDSPSAAKGLSP